MLLFGDMSKTTQDDRVWRALADPARRKMLDLLAAGPQTTGQLVEQFDRLCRTAVMKHLGILVAADLVVVVRSGRTRWNHLNPVPLATLCEPWLTHHTRRMAKSLQRLKQITELPP